MLIAAAKISRACLELVFYYLYDFFFASGGIPITEDKLIKIMPEWGPCFTVSFDLMISKFIGDYYKSILSFTTDPSHCCEVGDRVPAILLEMDTKQFHVATQIDDNGNSNMNSEINVETNRWYHIEMSQKIENDKDVSNCPIILN